MTDDIYPRNLEDGLKDDIQERIQLFYRDMLVACGIASGDITPWASIRLEEAEGELIGAVTAWILEGMSDDSIHKAQNLMDGKTSASNAIKTVNDARPDDTPPA